MTGRRLLRLRRRPPPPQPLVSDPDTVSPETLCPWTGADHDHNRPVAHHGRVWMVCDCGHAV